MLLRFIRKMDIRSHLNEFDVIRSGLNISMMIVFLCNCSDKEKERVFPIGDYREITQSLSVQDFESIKSFILENGDRQTYCNMLLDNPHYSYEGFEAYLNPEIGQKNIRCDPEISDFNMRVSRDQHSDPQYYQ